MDLTWVFPTAARIVRNWRVLSDLEPMSDHVYIELEVEMGSKRWRRNLESQKRWSVRKMDYDILIAALIVCS